MELSKTACFCFCCYFAFVAIWEVWWMLEVFAFKLGVLKVIDDDRWQDENLLNCWIVVSIGLTRWWIVELFVTEARSMQEARFKMIQDWKSWLDEYYYLFTSLSSFISPIHSLSSFISPKIQKGAKKNPKCRIPAATHNHNQHVRALLHTQNTVC